MIHLSEIGEWSEDAILTAKADPIAIHVSLDFDPAAPRTENPLEHVAQLLQKKIDGR